MIELAEINEIIFNYCVLSLGWRRSAKPEKLREFLNKMLESWIICFHLEGCEI